MGRLSEPPQSAAPDHEPGVHINALNLLRQRGVAVDRVIRVNTDSVLYISANGRPMTAWLAYREGRLDLGYEGGFQAVPAAWIARRLWPAPELDAGPSENAD